MTPEAPTPSSIAKYVEQHAEKIRNAAHTHSHAGAETVREADYKGHHITVRTTYTVEVDGQIITGHLGVSDNGQVHYHPVPNLEFASAIDLVKKLIDVFPDDFKRSKPKRPQPEHEHHQPAAPPKPAKVKGGHHGGH